MYHIQIRLDLDRLHPKYRKEAQWLMRNHYCLNCHKGVIIYESVINLLKEKKRKNGFRKF